MKPLKIIFATIFGLFLIAATTYQFTYTGAQIAAFYDWVNTISTSVSTTEAGYLDGVTSSIQAQIDSKLASTHTSTYDHTKIATALQPGGVTESDISDLGTTVQMQLAEGPFVAGDKTLLDSALQPGDTLQTATGTDPDVTTQGQISHDTDGANVTNDQTIRAVDGSGNQWPIGQKIVTLTYEFNTSGAMTNWQPDTNESGMTFNVVRWFVRSDTDDLVVSMAEFTGIHDSTVLNEMGSITASSDATGGVHFYGSQLAGVMTQTALETQHGWDFDISAAAVGWIKIQGWFDANVD